MPVGAGIEGLRADSAFARFAGQALRREPFRLVDIGCAGGLAPGWRTFGERLAAICIDGDGQEIERLSGEEPNPNVHYYAGLVGVPSDHPLQDVIAGRVRWCDFGFGRLACERHEHLRQARAEGREPLSLVDYLLVHAVGFRTRPSQVADTDYLRTFEVYMPTAVEVAAAANPANLDSIYLPAFLTAKGFDDTDFLKLDIDGPDYEVLRSATAVLQRPSLLGVALEVDFFGSHDANDNSFHNMDRLMREKGFDLFGLSVRPYASAALPPPYLSAYPSLNVTGRPMQGDAIYLRDLASTTHWAECQAVSDEKLVKLAALFSLFNLADQAAELLIVHRDRMAPLLDCDAGLELLAADVQHDSGAGPLSYPDYIAAFEREDFRFFDVYSRRETWLAGLLEAKAAEPALLARVAALEAERDQLKAQLGSPTPAPTDDAPARPGRGRDGLSWTRGLVRRLVPGTGLRKTE